MLPASAPSSLSLPLTSFIGREREVEAVRALLARDDVRLLTLTGPGGVGKTRLALEVARSGASFPDGVWFVPLAAIRDASLVLPAVATALGLRGSKAHAPEEAIHRFLRHRRALLVLDNVEQVLAAGPHLTELLTHSAHVKLLITSRFPLRVSGEHRFAVPPLAIGGAAPGQPAGPPAEAIRLFVARAEAVRSEFSLTPANIGDVAEICRQLDGLPLAIELAAARIAALPPAILLQHLQRRLPLLVGGPRDAPDRLQTMRNAIAWSYDLLDQREQANFRRLSIFTGGFTLDAAAGVLGRDALDDVTSLAEKHLLERAADAGGRFTMLETIREYGLELLAASGEEGVIRARHAASSLALAVRADYSWHMPLADAMPLIARLRADHANLRAARAWFVQTGDTESELRLAGSLGSLWVVLGQSREGREWLEAALARGAPLSTAGGARATATLSWVVLRSGDTTRALAVAAGGEPLARALGDFGSVWQCQIVAGCALIAMGDFERSAAFLRDALTSLTAVAGQPEWTHHAGTKVVEQLAKHALLRGDLAAAEVYCLQALARQRPPTDAPGTSDASDVFAGHVLAMLGDVARANRDQATALRHYQAALDLAVRAADVSRIARGLSAVAGTLACANQWPLAARLFGASEAYSEAMGFRFREEGFDRQRALGLPEPWQRADEACGSYQRLRDHLRARGAPPVPVIPDPAAATAFWAAGKKLPVDEAVARALNATLTGPAPGDAAALSPREQEVLRLLVIGQSNRSIADRLSVSERTVENHVQHILNKLGLDSRTAAATYAVRQGLV